MNKNEIHTLERNILDFESLLNNTKNFEIIFSIIKDVTVGDKVLIKETKYFNYNHEYLPNCKGSIYYNYTGREITKEISYVSRLCDYIKEDNNFVYIVNLI